MQTNKEKNEAKKYKGKKERKQIREKNRKVESKKEKGKKMWKGNIIGKARHREKDRQCTYNVTYRSVRTTIVAMEKL
jgi:hypothetical protein